MIRTRRTLGVTALALTLGAPLAVTTASAAPAAPTTQAAPAAPTTQAAPAAPAVQTPSVASATQADILDRLNALPRVSATEKTAPTGYRFFTIDYTQDVDHRDPSKGTFTQRLTLLHKDVSRPMVMYTGGYYVSQNPNRSEPTRIVDGNQLSMEYRFFDPSRPAQPDWEEQLTIWQAATDQHEIIETFKGLYDQNWLTTGGSKGGMTATYHRRFYPDDVSGSIPYVAPNDVRDHQDVYNAFLDEVGDDQACRDTLTGLQRRALGADRQWFLDRAAADSAANGYTYDIVGDLEKAVESGVVDAYFAFWQYSKQSDCATLPDPRTASNETVYGWFEQVSPLTVYADQSTGYYTPYYFQAAYQLGSPEPYENRIGDLLTYPGADVAMTFVPDAVKPSTFDRAAMPDVDKWVRKESERMLYVYGANDPWSAEDFDCGPQGAARDCHRYYVAGGNHGSNIAQLPEAERTKATELVLEWAGLGANDPAVTRVAKNGKPAWNAALDKNPVLLERAQQLKH
ncbi:S28 family serine protease [Janibacter sp. G56]|uniref:S28 family serine protease n=1 Tax=Janibacter sp. G56 TaxID=3418717 RepID=UPI003D01273B